MQVEKEAFSEANLLAELASKTDDQLRDDIKRMESWLNEFKGKHSKAQLQIQNQTKNLEEVRKRLYILLSSDRHQMITLPYLVSNVVEILEIEPDEKDM